MARSDPQLNIRIPEELKQSLESAAKASGRSLTQEMIFRLQQSLDPQGATVHMSAPLVYLLLDSHGYPQSWEEIRTLFRALIYDNGLDVVSSESIILTPDMESSSRRMKEATALAKKLRAGGKSVLLPKGA